MPYVLLPVFSTALIVLVDPLVVTLTRSGFPSPEISVAMKFWTLSPTLTDIGALERAIAVAQEDADGAGAGRGLRHQVEVAVAVHVRQGKMFAKHRG